MANLNVKGTITINGECIFPVGHILLETSTTEPASIYGGTWKKLQEGYALWTASDGAVQVDTNGNITSGTIEAGVPNITGDVYLGWWDTSVAGPSLTGESHSGALGESSKYYDGVVYPTRGTSLTLTGKYNTITFNANTSNSIYGNSTTVQPPAIKVYAWIRIA